MQHLPAYFYFFYSISPFHYLRFNLPISPPPSLYCLFVILFFIFIYFFNILFIVSIITSVLFIVNHFFIFLYFPIFSPKHFVDFYHAHLQKSYKHYQKQALLTHCFHKIFMLSFLFVAFILSQQCYSEIIYYFTVTTP